MRFERQYYDEKGALDKVAAYELLKFRWIAEHPDATPQEYRRAMQIIAKRCGV